MVFSRSRSLEDVARNTCKVLLRKSRTRNVSGEELDECITIVRRFLSGETSVHETAATLASLFGLRYTEVEREILKARRYVEQR